MMMGKRNRMVGFGRRGARLWLYAAFSLFLLCAASRVGAQSQNVECLGWVNIPCYQMITQGNVAYVNAGQGLRILDLAAPAQPVEISRLDLAEGLGAFAACDGFVYGVENGNLHIIDAQDPNAPRIRSTMQTPPHQGYGVDLAAGAGVVYLCTDQGLSVFDVGNPDAPKLTQTYPSYVFSRMALAEGRLYAYGMQGGAGKIWILDVSNPKTIATLGTAAATAVQQIVVQGQTVYAIGADSGLLALDVTNPARPSVRLSNPGLRGEAVSVAGGLGCLANYQDGLQVFDLGNPGQAVRCGAFYPGHSAYTVTMAGDLIYLATMDAVEKRLYVLRSTSTVPPPQPTPIPMPAGNFKLLQQLGGACDHIAVEDGLIYTSEGPNLVILKREEDGTLAVQARLPLGTAVGGLAVSNGMVYLSSPNNGLLVVDAGDPAAPVLRGLLARGGDWRRIAVSNGTACLLDEKGAAFIDVSQPETPVTRGRLALAPDAKAVIISDGYAFIASQDHGFYAFDIHNLDAPTTCARMSSFTEVRKVSGSWVTITTEVKPSGLALDGKTVYLANGKNGVMALDASRPSTLKVTGNWTGWGNAADVAYENGLLLIAGEREGFKIGNLEGTMMGKLPLANRDVRTVAAGGGRALVSVDGELNLIGMGDPSHPGVEARYGTIATVNDLSLEGGRACVATANKLQVYDLPGSPAMQLRGVLTVDAPPSSGSLADDRVRGVTHAGARAGLAVAEKLKIVDLTDPASPLARFDVDLGASVRCVRLDGTLAYSVVDQYPGQTFQIHDLSIPTTATYLGRVEDATAFHDILSLVVRGGRVYSINQSCAFSIFDVGRPESPVLLNEYGVQGADIDSQAYDLDVAGDHAYIAADRRGVHCFDVSDPAFPRFVGAFPATANRIVAEGNMLFAADGGSVKAIDASDPARPRWRGAMPLPFAPTCLRVAGDRIYAGTAGGGLYALQYTFSGVWVTSPNGGELIAREKPLTIHWISDPAVAGTQVQLELWNSKGWVCILGRDEAASGEHDAVVTVPGSVPGGSDYRIKLISVADPDLSDWSDAPFSISVPPPKDSAAQGNWGLYR